MLLKQILIIQLIISIFFIIDIKAKCNYIENQFKHISNWTNNDFNLPKINDNPLSGNKDSLKNEYIIADTINVGKRKQLFIDDYIIENITNVKKVLNQGNKISLPILKVVYLGKKV